MYLSALAYTRSSFLLASVSAQITFWGVADSWYSMVIFVAVSIILDPSSVPTYSRYLGKVNTFSSELYR